MKIKPDFVLSKISNENVVVPVGALGAKMHGMITLNDSGAFLWKELQSEKTEEELVASVLKSYPETKPAVAIEFVRDFVKQLKDADCLV